MSRVSNHINRNIEQDRSADADIEIVNLNSSDGNTNKQDSERFEDSLNDAWRFINAARRQNFTYNEENQRIHREYDSSHMQDGDQTNYVNRHNPTWCKTSKNRKQDRNLNFSNINDYLDALDNSSDEETQNEAQRHLFDNIQASREAIEIYDGTIYAVSDEGPMLIYSYKNKFYTSDANQVPINSPNQSSQSNSTGSISVENLNEESVNYDRSFYRISSSFHPVMIPRLSLGSLGTYMLPTVTEIIEPTRQSPKITELSVEDIVSIKQKPSNSWVMNDEDSSHSEADNTTETNLENSCEESSTENNEQKLQPFANYTDNQLEQDSKVYVEENRTDCKSKVLFATNPTFKPVSTRDSAGSKNNEKTIVQQRNNYLDANEIEVDLAAKDTENDSTLSIHRNSSPVELLSKRSSIPTLHLSLNTEPDASEESWFNKFIKCVFCCK